MNFVWNISHGPAHKKLIFLPLDVIFMQKEQICYKFVITGLGKRETEKEWGDRDRMRENDL